MLGANLAQERFRGTGFVIPLTLLMMALPVFPLARAAEKGERSATMTDIQGIEELKALFRADEGSSRLILLLSPT